MLVFVVVPARGFSVTRGVCSCSRNVADASLVLLRCIERYRSSVFDFAMPVSMMFGAFPVLFASTKLYSDSSNHARDS